MGTVTVECERSIARPVEVVRAQFADMQHHLDTRVHSALEFSDLQTRGGICHFTSRRRVLGIPQTDQVELEQLADGTVSIRVVDGANKGVTIVQRFTAQGADRTLVQVRLDMPVSGLKRWLAPLLRVGLKRDLVLGLEEDRRDLEDGGYQHRAAPSTTAT